MVIIVVSVVAITGDDICMSKTANLRIFRNGLEMLVPMLEPLGCWNETFGSLAAFYNSGFELVLSDFVFCRFEEVD